MPKRKWDAPAVAKRMEEAANTMKRLPEDGVRPRGHSSSWPPFLREYWESYGMQDVKVRLGPPTPDAIDRMDEALSWLHTLEPDQAKLVWLRAEKVPWKFIMAQLGVCRETARQRYLIAMATLSAKLNQQKNA
ncbi:conserved hypothetical protein [Magnetococcus marinus MC-1]|uniref:DUF6362 domain-containing protein n=1 Tax=Magnetococcus marinus (strain ATCC BAA-1437 / JCM 17883 / MC-1) TaxID=156889 RepID=A0LBI8_MAGMM|nr:DUF6362 family protein [Magnetococcus marinus]ABK45331.1 conserved hypothetical protein [Magnetococcus marinus MC-1]